MPRLTENDPRTTSPIVISSVMAPSPPVTAAAPAPVTTYQEIQSPGSSWLEAQVGSETAGRIRQLLSQRFVTCLASAPPGTEYANCFGTALWVAGVDSNPRPQMFGDPNDHAWQAYDSGSLDQEHQNLIRLFETRNYAGSRRCRFFLIPNRSQKHIKTLQIHFH